MILLMTCVINWISSCDTISSPNNRAISKERLQMGEFLVLLDFAKNYSFVLQDAAQGFHCGNSVFTEPSQCQEHKTALSMSKAPRCSRMISALMTSQGLSHADMIANGDWGVYWTLVLIQRNNNQLPSSVRPCTIICLSQEP